jgi:hypothetical protein
MVWCGWMVAGGWRYTHGLWHLPCLAAIGEISCSIIGSLHFLASVIGIVAGDALMLLELSRSFACDAAAAAAC